MYELYQVILAVSETCPDMNCPSFLQTTDLLTFDPGTVPIVKRTSKGEFLVNAGTFGVIAVANGISNVRQIFCFCFYNVAFTSPSN